MFRVFVIAFILGAWSGPAHAYVDPGILSTLYQALYAIVFGVAAAWIMRPWAWLKTLFPARRRKLDAAGSGNGGSEERQD